MKSILASFITIAEIINIIGVIILLYGFVKELFQYLITEIKTGFKKTPLSALQKIRSQLGIYILLALDFLIASDIILSIADLSMDQLINLGVTVVIRIAIGYFLGKEMEDVLHQPH